MLCAYMHLYLKTRHKLPCTAYGIFEQSVNPLYWHAVSCTRVLASHASLAVGKESITYTVHMAS